jgi:hypothetical protein
VQREDGGSGNSPDGTKQDSNSDHTRNNFVQQKATRPRPLLISKEEVRTEQLGHLT